MVKQYKRSRVVPGAILITNDDNNEVTSIREGDEHYEAAIADGAVIEDADPDPRTPQQIWADIRSKRDGLLAETDWVVVKAQEVGEAVPAAWATYRQALRDLPANTADPANPVWPTKP